MPQQPRLAIQYPRRYKAYFDPFCDFYVFKESEVTARDFNLNKPIWLDCSDGSRAVADCDGVILPTSEDPDLNVILAAKGNYDCKRIGIWIGEKRHLKLMEQAVDIVALPFYEPGRTAYIESDKLLTYHYYGFCNLDELRRFPPASLHTDIPITAAALGIDLRTRERRPKKLPPFSYDMYLGEQQLELAINNVRAVREALDAGFDLAPHTKNGSV